jgi:hypothetical protein
MSGADLRGACDGHFSDHAVGWWGPGGATAPIWVGDWTGDGVDEWVLSDRNANGGEEGLWIFSGDQTVSGEFTADDALGSWVIPSDTSSLTYPQVFDLDGDGLQELSLVGLAGRIVMHGGSPLSFGAEFPERQLRYEKQMACENQPCNGDFNADGFDDLLASVTGDDDLTRVGIIYGFEVPWDDDARW